MKKRIIGAVGSWEKGALNRPKDVIAVQELLTNLAKGRSRFDCDPKGIDGKIARPPRSSNTVKAILTFQSTFLRKPDGLVEPNKMTLIKLNQAAMIGQNSNAKNMDKNHFFPLSFVPSLSYKGGARYFGARRNNGKRKHAGCDLIAPVGTKVYAVASGIVVRKHSIFYKKTYSIEIKHPHFLARYCEIKHTPELCTLGDRVEPGQHIGYVGKLDNSSMLHFELYKGTMSGRLSQKNPPYNRRSDLIDPTPYLDKWKGNLPS